VFLDVGVDASPPTGFHFEVHERLTEVEEKDEFEKEDDEDEDKQEESEKKYPRVTTKPGNHLIFAIKNGHTDIAHL
jgi:hypothetical protein